MVELELVAEYINVGLQVCPEIGGFVFGGIFRSIGIAPVPFLSITCPRMLVLLLISLFPFPAQDV